MTWKRKPEEADALLDLWERVQSGIFMGKPVDYWLGLEEQLEVAQLRDKMRDDGEHALLGEVEARDAQIAELERMNARLIRQNRRLLEASEEETPAASDGTEPETSGHGSAERLSRPATSSSEASSPAKRPT